MAQSFKIGSQSLEIGSQSLEIGSQSLEIGSQYLKDRKTVKKRTVSLIIENQKNEILLMLRDNKPTIPCPNHWAFIGGLIDPGETPIKAIVREVKEELGLNLNMFMFFKTEILRGIEYNIFYIRGNFKPTDFVVGEGQAISFFSKDKIAAAKSPLFSFRAASASFFAVLVEFWMRFQYYPWPHIH